MHTKACIKWDLQLPCGTIWFAQFGFILVQVKTAMLDSANETVSVLKGEVADLNAELDEARRCTEESEQQFRRMHDQGEQERASLRCDRKLID